MKKNKKRQGFVSETYDLRTLGYKDGKPIIEDSSKITCNLAYSIALNRLVNMQN